MKKISLLLVIGFVFVGCSSKSYFKPEKVTGSVNSQKMDYTIESVSNSGALLSDGYALSKNGNIYNNLKNPKRFIYGDSSKLIYTKDDNSLKIDMLNIGTTRSVQFDTAIVGANSKNNLLAIIFANNKIALFDMDKNETLFSETLEKVIALNTKVANPIFLGELVIFPTLDGKIIIYDTTQKKVVREIILTNERYFNNAISLEVIKNRLIASTQTKVISINPTFFTTLDIDISDIKFYKDRVFILSKDGKVTICDEDLRILSEKKFPFSQLTGVVAKGEKIYIAERSGYIVESDLNLTNYKIYSSTKFDDSFFASNSKFYTNKSVVEIK